MPNASRFLIFSLGPLSLLAWVGFIALQSLDLNSQVARGAPSLESTSKTPIATRLTPKQRPLQLMPKNTARDDAAITKRSAPHSTKRGKQITAIPSPSLTQTFESGKPAQSIERNLSQLEPNFTFEHAVMNRTQRTAVRVNEETLGDATHSMRKPGALIAPPTAHTLHTRQLEELVTLARSVREHPSSSHHTTSSPTARTEQRSSSLPIPIKFTYGEERMTEEGKVAAQLLLNYLKTKDFDKISLTGHADERGSETFNLDLSRKRLDSIARFLRDGGYKGDLTLIPRGEAEPFNEIDRQQYSAQDLYELDRRVELRLLN